MGKRSTFERKPRDFYPTPEAAVLPLTLALRRTSFYEPCVGEGHLVAALTKHGYHCTGGSDLPVDATTHDYTGPAAAQAECFITNPPWDRKVLHPIIENLRKQKPTWLLIDADWAHTKQAGYYIDYCEMIVPVGRLKWVPGSKYTGKDNCCWYKFGTKLTNPIFTGRHQY